jgi:CHASE3 domain sensor protein
MILELAAIVSTVNVATSALNKVAGATSDIQQISSFLGALGEAQHDLQKIKNTQPLSASEAIQHQLTQKQINDTLSEIKDIFLVSGNSHLWDNAMQAMADARVARQNQINKAIAKRKARIKELKEAGVIILIAVIIVPVAIFALLYTIIN